MMEQLENDRVSELAESIVLSYLKQKEQKPDTIICVDIEGLIKEKFGFNIQYESIVEDDPNKVAYSANGTDTLKVSRNGHIEKVVFPADTIVIDKILLDNAYSVQRRFTLGHEVGHKIYEKISPVQKEGRYRTIFDRTISYTAEELHKLMDICEAQANKIGCALLMPRFLLVNTLRRVMGEEHFRMFGFCQMLPEDSLKLDQMANDLGVSPIMLMIELKNNRLIRNGDMETYLETVGLGGGGSNCSM